MYLVVYSPFELVSHVYERQVDYVNIISFSLPNEPSLRLIGTIVMHQSTSSAMTFFFCAFFALSAFALLGSNIWANRRSFCDNYAELCRMFCEEAVSLQFNCRYSKKIDELQKPISMYEIESQMLRTLKLIGTFPFNSITFLSLIIVKSIKLLDKKNKN